MSVTTHTPQQTLARTSSNKKRIRFSSSVVEEFVAESVLEDKRSVWWSREEVECMESKALYSAEESRKNKVLVDTLDQALRDARRSALASRCNEVTSVIDSDRDLLHLWCQYGHSRRGLEKWASRIHRTTRDNIVRKARSNVVALSRNGASPDEIRVASEKASRSSTIFASMIAAADAKAVLYPLTERRRSNAQMMSKQAPLECTTTAVVLVRGSSRRSVHRQGSNQRLLRV